MLGTPDMAKRHRTRPRTRRAIESARRTPAPESERQAPATTTATARRDPHRVTRSVRGGYSRALGAPSAALERSAVLERGFVVKDFRRLGLVVAIALALLIVSGVLESVLLH